MMNALRLASLALVPCLVGVLGTGCKKGSDAASSDGGSASSPGLAAAVASALGLGFEGDVTMHTTSVHAPPQDLTFHIKGQKIRVDVPAQHGEEAHVVFDQAADKTYAILDTQKMYMEIDHTAARATAAAPTQPAKITQTGKHETIAGVDCEDWDIVESTGKKASVCVAQGISFFDWSGLRPGATTTNQWIDELRTKKAFPLKAVEMDNTGKEIGRMEVTKIEKKSLDDSMFAIPAGYRSLSSMMPNGMPGMPGMPGGGPHPGVPHPGVPHPR